MVWECDQLPVSIPRLQGVKSVIAQRDSAPRQTWIIYFSLITKLLLNSLSRTDRIENLGVKQVTR